MFCFLVCKGQDRQWSEAMNTKPFSGPASVILFRIFLFLIIFSLFVSVDASVLSTTLRSSLQKDTTSNVWVFFRDKDSRSQNSEVSPKALERRRKAAFRADESCLPVKSSYIREVQKRGGKLRHVFKWENAASFSVHSSSLQEITSLPFVEFVGSVKSFLRRRPEMRMSKKTADSLYGELDYHLRMCNIPAAHEYLQAKGMGDPGSGVLMGFFDCGFRLDHKVFSHTRENVIAVRDFVDGDETVQDPDSVATDYSHDYYQNDVHGTQTLALVAGYSPGDYMSIAWGAQFVLARTENSPNPPNELEERIEEDNWAAAVVWAESLGVDIVSSSLGYRDGFTDPEEDYTYEDIDGNTTVVSRAAAQAVRRGMLIVNSMGNEGADSSGTLTAPADVEGVISVGAVDRSENIAFFSSTGPTSDGRIKPDVLALGTNVPVPAPYSADLASYTYQNGTSFSTPVVSGICALISQASNYSWAEQVRNRLFSSCRFAEYQTDVDNRYGRGIPDALAACMDENEIFVKLKDSAGTVLQGAEIKMGSRTYKTNESGVAVIDAGSDVLPLAMDIDYRGMAKRSMDVNVLPSVHDVVLDVRWPSGPYFKVYPTVLKRGGTLNVEYTPDLSGVDAFTSIQAVIRSLDGNVVWKHSQYPQENGMTRISWNGKNRGRRVVPGLYFFILKYGNSIQRRKVMIIDD